ncbi:MAG: hypothetical protein HYY81_05985 [Deltaproteobacteria bacterium]|nr:hypothetical protein [Deltaproteobacteria bacterium]
MKKVFKIVGLSAIALALFIAVLLFSFYYLIQVGEFRSSSAKLKGERI